MRAALIVQKRGRMVSMLTDKITSKEQLIKEGRLFTSVEGLLEDLNS